MLGRGGGGKGGGGDYLLENMYTHSHRPEYSCTLILWMFSLLGKLRLKIPWKNLYSAPVVAEIDGLYVLAGPAAGMYP